MTAGLDGKDRAILGELQKDCRASCRQLSRKLGIPATTVYKRVQRLEKNGVIKGYSAVIDSEEVGNPAVGIVLIEAELFREIKDKVNQKMILDEISKKPNIQDAFLLTGQYDMLLKVRGKDAKEIGQYVMNKLRNVVGIGRTHTSMVVYTAKETWKIKI